MAERVSGKDEIIPAMQLLSNKQDKPEKLYHYTSIEGLLGILNDHALWATKIQYLNDASELSKPIAIAFKKLEEATSITTLPEKKKKELNELGSKLLNSWSNVNLCVASFCKEGDLLSQWRGYGSYGSAFSIGFNTKILEKKVSLDDFELLPCEYLDQEAYEEKVYELLLQASAEAIKSPNKSLDFVGRFVKTITGIKLDCFKEENEWRVISSNPKLYHDKNFKFRSGRSMIIPYYALPLDLESIDEIVIGPCQHPGLVERAVNGLANKYKLKNLLSKGTIKVSSIPYRVF